MIYLAIALAVTASSILAAHLLGHREERRRQRVRDGYLEREALAQEYRDLLLGIAFAYPDKELLDCRPFGKIYSFHMTPQQVKDAIAKKKAEKCMELQEALRKSEELQKELWKQVEILSGIHGPASTGELVLSVPSKGTRKKKHVTE